MNRWRIILAIVGIFYGISSLLSFFTFIFFIAYGQGTDGSVPNSALRVLLISAPLLNAILSGAIMYSLLKPRNWGSYLTIGYNAIWVGGVIISTIKARLVEDNLPPLTQPAILFLFFSVVVPLGIIFLLMRKEVKNLMVDNMLGVSKHEV